MVLAQYSLLKHIDFSSIAPDFVRNERRLGVGSSSIVSHLQEASHHIASQGRVTSAVLTRERENEGAGKHIKLMSAGSGVNRQAPPIEGTPHESNTEQNKAKSSTQRSSNQHETSDIKQKVTRKVTTVFSTRCSPFQDWQSQAL
jgi:hypothetical protein